MEKTKLFFFKRNVEYVIGLRYFIGDSKGKTLTSEDPFVAIEEDDLRDFKRANKFLLDEGLLIPTEEPALEEESPNAISDAKALELVKNVFVLKKALVDITSESMLVKLLELAKESNRSKRTIELISNRLEQVKPAGTMIGIENGTVGGAIIRDGVKTYNSGTEEDMKKAVRSRT